jgi:hypothetical protein
VETVQGWQGVEAAECVTHILHSALLSAPAKAENLRIEQ